MKTIARNIARKIFHFFINLIFSNDPRKIAQVQLPGRYQLVWASEHTGRKIILRLYERAETRFFLNQLRPNDVCLDIGANIGYYTNLFASVVGKQGTVVAIEPIPRNAQLISLNTLLNQTDDFVKVVCAAASTSDGAECSFLQTTDSGYAFVMTEQTGSRGISDNTKPDSQRIVVHTTTIDAIVSSLSLARVDIIKIDVEGFEYHVLKGMTKLLSNPGMRPRLIMMELVSDHLKYYNSSISTICEFLNDYGYTAKILGNDGGCYPFEQQHYDTVSNVFFMPTNSDTT